MLSAVYLVMLESLFLSSDNIFLEKFNLAIQIFSYFRFVTIYMPSCNSTHYISQLFFNQHSDFLLRTVSFSVSRLSRKSYFFNSLLNRI